MFSFFKKKPAPKSNPFSLENQYEDLLKMSQDYPEACKTEETDDFVIIFIDYGVRHDTYTNEEISMEGFFPDDNSATSWAVIGAPINPR